jgi:hypothetical protein
MASSKDIGQDIADAAAEVGLVGGRVIFDDSRDGWNASVVWNDAKLILDLSRECFVARIERTGQRPVEIDEPKTWGTFYPEAKKIRFYLGVFRAFLEGKLADRVYEPKKPNQPPEPTAMSVTTPAAQEPRQP